MVEAAPEVRFAQVLGQLLTERYKRNRAALAQAAHVSPSALSQYVRGKATPSLDVLVHLAGALDVSIDYLVLGEDQQSSNFEAGYLSSQLEAGIRRAQTDAAALHDLVARVGARLGQQIKAAAQELLPEAVSGTGALTADEATMVEGCSLHTSIVTSSLDTEVLVLPTGDNEETAAPGPFAEVVVKNIEEHQRYEYFLPQYHNLDHSAYLLRQQVIEKSSLDPTEVDRYLKIYHVPRACAPGYLIYQVPITDLQRNAEVIYDRVAPFFATTASNPGMAHIVTVEPASRSYRNFALLDANLVPGLLLELEELRRTSTPAEYGSHPEEGR
jgi:transcriptional regulator with XRE-family HTH domain